MSQDSRDNINLDNVTEESAAEKKEMQEEETQIQTSTAKQEASQEIEPLEAEEEQQEAEHQEEQQKPTESGEEDFDNIEDELGGEIIDYELEDTLDADHPVPDETIPAKEPFDLKKEIISWIKMIVAAIVLAVIITQFIIINANVPTGSMENTIPTGSRIMGLRLTYLFHDPERFDVVVFKYQFAAQDGEDNINYVKRIIGLPGEKVEISNGKINIYQKDENGNWVYDTTLSEPYLKEEWVKKNDGYTFTVPEDKYFVLGDNRNNSADTRDWYDEKYQTGKCEYDELFVSEDDILGKIYFTYYPSFNMVND